MLLTITNTHPPATDLGYLLYKHPSRFQSFPLSFGNAHVFYPEANSERCTAALILEMDAIGLARRRRGPAGEGHTLEHYVNDRPYVASSFLSVAISQVYGSALSGKCKERPELASTALPLQAKLAVLPCQGGEKLLRRLFEPLGYQVTAQGYVLDEQFPDWGESGYFTVTLEATCCLSILLTHLYVLVPVLDNEKHYWVGDDEVEKLLRYGDNWLAEHPGRELIVDRYLRHQRRLTRQALARLLEEDEPDPDAAEVLHAQEEENVEAHIGLNQQRLDTVMAVLKSCGVKRVLDLGCGEGKLLKMLLEDKSFKEIVGVDVSHRALEIAQKRLRLEELSPKQRERIQLLQGALTYWDKRFVGYDAATVVEVIEHLDPPRIAAFERVLFECARPRVVVLTTPNAEYNVQFESLPAGKFRHKDHRFEWTRGEFQLWAKEVGTRFGYSVRFQSVGQEDSVVGPPTQMGVFTLS
jgi:3' terminal RNA ribose 2'-O-methyltransferase Hen1